MTVPILSQLPEPFVTVILIGLLILAFVVAFKILKMVMQTLLISVLSAGFYVALVFIGFFNGFEFNQLLFFSFLGSGLYLFYSVLASTYTVMSKVLAIPYKVIVMSLIPFKIVYRDIRDHLSKEKIKEKTKSVKADVKEEDNPSDPKEVVLDKLNKEEEEDKN